MSKNQSKKPVRSSRPPGKKKGKEKIMDKPIIWALIACIVTAIVFVPMLSNEFTNWDDQFYITSNPMLIGPDWKAIFSRPLMANYHPLTVATLALNYQASALSPFTYHLVNWLLHIINTGLVFFVAFRLSENNRWVGLITSLFFGLHPMHVESVAWASERKDVLFTVFFLLSMLGYLRYMQQPDIKKYAVSFLLFVLSLLSKPAAVTLPLVLLLIDWYKGRSLKDKKVWLEKVPFFIMSLTFGLLSLKYQQAVQAIAAPELYPFWQKIVFSFYGFGEYVKRLFWPFPMSAIHPFPDAGVIPISFFPGFIIAAIVIALAFYYRNKKFILFGILFYAINIALVLQLLTFGHSVISERYTYVPYIGLTFLIAMAWSKSKMEESTKKIVLFLLLGVCLVFAIMSFRQISVWKNSGTLWSNAIETYPNSYIARSNRGQYLSAKLAKYDEALEDYKIALAVQPNDSFSLINRATIYINQQNFTAALSDADSLIAHVPNIAKGYLFHGISLFRLGNPQQAYEDFTNCIRRDSFAEECWLYRGVVRYNNLQDFAGAKGDFDRAIMITPTKGLAYKNRARCWIKLGNSQEALRDIKSAKQFGEQIEDSMIEAAQALQ